MNINVGEWANLLLRWAHIIAGIAWIGSSFFFMWLDRHLQRPAGGDSGRGGVQGELWMVHSGGFYRVEKKQLQPAEVPGTLHWFKWEATFTGITGFFLLCIVYYLGGAMVDRNASLSEGAAIGLGLGLLVVAYPVYDLVWRSPLERTPWLGALVSFAMVGASAYALSRLMGARAAYIHIGAGLGTIMVVNVWHRILPAQRALIRATQQGVAGDPALADRAKARSTHNNYMTLPVVFIMISNHFSASTYGYHWLMLAALMLAGAGVRHLMNVGRRGALAAAGSFLLLIAVTAWLAPPVSDDGAGETTTPGGPPAETAGPAPAPTPPIDAATAATLRGVVRFEGKPPARKELKMGATPACAAMHPKPALSEDAVVADGKLANAFVWVKAGLEGYQFPPPASRVVIDQVGCIYRPHVVGVQVGQPLVFLNSDETYHNVHLVPAKNPGANVPMAGAGIEKTFRFKRVEVMIPTQCDAHGWMAASVGVVPHPFFRVTGVDGAFEMKGLPPGRYTLEAWHERFGAQTATVDVGPKGDRPVDFTFREGE
jgi:uncharacterized membrane protein/plastocyanin